MSSATPAAAGSSHNAAPRIKLSQSALYFPPPTKPNQVVENLLAITNLEGAMVLFKVRTSAPENYSVKPRVGVLHPREDLKVKISFVSREGHPRALPTDRFSIEVRFVDPQHDDTNNPESCWPRHGEKLAETDPRAKMPVAKIALLCDNAANGVPAGLVASEVDAAASSAAKPISRTTNGAALPNGAQTPANASSAAAMHTPRTAADVATPAFISARAAAATGLASAAAAATGEPQPLSQSGGIAAAARGAAQSVAEQTASRQQQAMAAARGVVTSAAPFVSPTAAPTATPQASPLGPASPANATVPPPRAATAATPAKASKGPLVTRVLFYKLPLLAVLVLMGLAFLLGLYFNDVTRIVSTGAHVAESVLHRHAAPPPPPPPPAVWWRQALSLVGVTV
jgi:hypothetical protein